MESIPPIKHDTEYIKKNKGKAAIFNNIFLSILSVDESNAQPLLAPRIVEQEMYLFNLNISEQDVMDQISVLDLNRSYSPDSIPPRLIKEGGRAVTKLLARPFYMSLQQCEFPKIWKSASVIPLHKKDDRDLVTNYRPVSLLSIRTVSNVFEKYSNMCIII